MWQRPRQGGEPREAGGGLSVRERRQPRESTASHAPAAPQRLFLPALPPPALRAPRPCLLPGASPRPSVKQPRCHRRGRPRSRRAGGLRGGGASRYDLAGGKQPDGPKGLERGPLGAASAPAGRARGNGAEPGDPSARPCFPEQGHWKRPASQRGAVTAWGEPRCGCEVLRKPSAKETPAARHPWGAAWARGPSGSPCAWDPSAGRHRAAAHTLLPSLRQTQPLQPRRPQPTCANSRVKPRRAPFGDTRGGFSGWGEASLRGAGNSHTRHVGVRGLPYEGVGMAKVAAGQPTVDQTSVGPGSRVGSRGGDPRRSLGDGVGGGA